MHNGIIRYKQRNYRGHILKTIFKNEGFYTHW